MDSELHNQSLKSAVVNIKQISATCFEADIASSDHLLELLFTDQLWKYVMLFQHLCQLGYRQYWLSLCNIIK